MLLLPAILLAAWLLSGCSPARHVPEGKYLLDDVK